MSWGLLLGNLTLDKAHYKIIEAPRRFIASKKKKMDDLLHILNFKKTIMQTSIFQEENLKEKKNIWRFSASPGSSQANMSAKLPMRSPRRMSNKSRSLWTVSMAVARGFQVPRAHLHLHLQQALKIPLAKEHCISSRCSSGQGCTFIHSTHPRAGLGL